MAPSTPAPTPSAAWPGSWGPDALSWRTAPVLAAARHLPVGQTSAARLIAMDPSAGASVGDTQDKKAEVFRAMPPADPQHCVRGQYQGYADVPGVASGSATETLVALRLEIDNWRWADVPVFLRAGKALSQKVTEVRLLLRRTPRLAFLPQPTRAEPNQIVLRIDPDPSLRLQLSALAGQSWRTVHLDTTFARELGEPPEPYEVLLHAAMAGDYQCFAREDSVEETWRIVQPLLDHPPDVRPYPRGVLGTRGGGSPNPGPPALAAAVAAREGLSP